MPAKPNHRRTVLPLTLAAGLAFVPLGCSSTQQIVDAPQAQQTTASTAELTAEIEDFWGTWWITESEMLDMGPENTGPTLATGDWLAWQCAYAGGYFETYSDTTYASVETD